MRDNSYITPEYRKKLSDIKKANPPKFQFKKGDHPSPDTEFKKGCVFTSRMKGKKHTEEWKQKLRERMLKNPIKYWLGKKQSKEMIEKRVHRMDKHYNWKGGISREPYGQGWDNILKESIRKRDSYKCQICGVPQEECFEALIVHHKDENKKNLNPKNLISLCRSCHVKLHHINRRRRVVV